MPDLLYEKADRIATITLNRPERLNAWGGDIPKMLPEAMAEADRDPEVACVVVTGAGRAFCAGLDLKEEAQREQARTMVGWLASPKTPIIMLNSNKPLVAAIPGPAIGVGFEFAMLCDYRIGATTAKMGDRHVALGLVPDSGAVITLPRVVGWANACKILLTGEIFEADELHAMGVLNEVVEPEELQEAARAFAGRIACNAPLATQMTKRLMRVANPSDVEAVLDYSYQVMGTMMQTADAKEAIAAFREKRTPNFSGR